MALYHESCRSHPTVQMQRQKKDIRTCGMTTWVLSSDHRYPSVGTAKPKKMGEPVRDLQLFLTPKVHNEINLTILISDLDREGMFGHCDEFVVDPALSENACRCRVEVQCRA